MRRLDPRTLGTEPSSLYGHLLPGVFLDADVSREAVDLGIIGPKPVGTGRTIRANLDYRFLLTLAADL